MARKRDTIEETDTKVSEEMTNNESRPERKRRTPKIIDEPTTEKTIEHQTKTVKADILNVRLGPGYGYKIEKQILKDTVVTIYNIENSFGEIEPGLWVDMKFLK